MWDMNGGLSDLSATQRGFTHYVDSHLSDVWRTDKGQYHKIGKNADEVNKNNEQLGRLDTRADTLEKRLPYSERN